MLKKLQTSPFLLLTTVRNSSLGRAIGKIDLLYKFLWPLYDWLDLFFFRLYWNQGNVVDVQGSKMFVDVFHSDFAMRQTFRHYALTRIHEKTTTDLFRMLVKRGDVFLDVGANIGYFTLLASNIVGKEGKVFSFEPEPRNYQYLLKNIALNNYSQTTAWQKAVSDKPGHVKLFLCPYDTGHHTIQQFEGIRSYNPKRAGKKEEFVEVETVRLDDFFQRKLTPIDVIKMDVEGAELFALSGMEGIIKANDNLAMFIEFFPLLIRKMGHSPEQLVEKIFTTFNFQVYAIADDYSMHDVQLSKRYLRAFRPSDIIQLCEKANDHLNLILIKGKKYARFFD